MLPAHTRFLQCNISEPRSARMPEAVGSSWADEIEEGDVTTLPPSSEKIKGDLKMVTDYSFNEDGKKVIFF